MPRRKKVENSEEDFNPNKNGVESKSTEDVVGKDVSVDDNTKAASDVKKRRGRPRKKTDAEEKQQVLIKEAKQPEDEKHDLSRRDQPEKGEEKKTGDKIKKEDTPSAKINSDKTNKAGKIQKPESKKNTANKKTHKEIINDENIIPEENIEDNISILIEEDAVDLNLKDEYNEDDEFFKKPVIEEEEETEEEIEEEVEEEIKDNRYGNDRKDNIKEMEIDIRKLSSMNIKDLILLAKKFKIQGYTRMRKNELVFSLMQAQAKNFGYFFNEGVLDIIPGEGYGFLRTGNLLPGNNDDIYVSQSQIRKFNLNSGDTVSGQVRAPKEGEKYFALLRIEGINFQPPEFVYDRINFVNLTPIFPLEKLTLEYSPSSLGTRIIDLFSPIGKGQRGLIVAPPKTGKTTLLKEIANGIAKNNPETKRIVLLIDERPEEVTDISRSVDAQVIAAPFDMPPEKQIKVAQLTLEMAKRLAESKYDVVILLDSITRLARAYNNFVPPSGKLLSGGVDPKALYGPKYFFGAARNLEEGGSLTIIATALVETGSKMDEVIFEEFKGTGNMELVLSRNISNKKIFPAININLSGTRKEELLYTEEEMKKVWILRKMLSSMSEEEGLQLIIRKLKETNTNEFFLKLLDKERGRV